MFVGAVIQWNITEYGQFIPNNVRINSPLKIKYFVIHNIKQLSVPGYLLIIVGAGLIIVAIIGCCCIAKISRWIVSSNKLFVSHLH